MKKELEEAKALFLLKLEENGAVDVKVLDESEELFPISWQIHAVLDGRWIQAILTLVNGETNITFYYKDKHDKDMSFKEFIQVLALISIDKPERTLERFKLDTKEQLILTHEMCEESKTMCTFYELKQKLN